MLCLLRLEITSSESPAWIPSPPKSLSPPQPLPVSWSRLLPSQFHHSLALFKWFEVWDLAGGPMVKNLPANAEDMGLIPDPGRFHMPQGN